MDKHVRVVGYSEPVGMASAWCMLVIIWFIFHNCNVLLRMPACTQPLPSVSSRPRCDAAQSSTPCSADQPGTGVPSGRPHGGHLQSQSHVSRWWRGCCFLVWAPLLQRVTMRSKGETENSLPAVSVELGWAFFRLGVLTGDPPLSGLCLWVLIMIEPLPQSSLVWYLINLELPAKLWHAVPLPVLPPL